MPIFGRISPLTEIFEYLRRRNSALWSQRNIDIFMALMTASYLELFFCWNQTLLMTYQLEIINKNISIFLTDFE